MQIAKTILKTTISLNLFLNSCFAFASDKAQVVAEIDSTFTSAQQQVMARMVDNKYWLYPMYLGAMYTSQYLLLRHWLERSFKNNGLQVNTLPPTRFNEAWYKQFLIQTQNKADGSWQLIADRNTIQGDLNATIFHYAALKVMGMKENDPVLLSAKNYILDRGGIEKASLFTKIVLALFGNYDWDDVPNVPYIVFSEKSPLNYKDFGQWIGPHLFPISYLKHVEAKKVLGKEFDLSELFKKIPNEIKEIQNGQLYESSIKPSSAEKDIVQKILRMQKINGSLGGYTSASLFGAVALQQYQHFTNDLDPQIDQFIWQSLSFVDNLYFNSGESSYLGVTCDGRYWDTAVVGQGLLESGMNPVNFKNSVEYLFSIQDQRSGGFGFGLDFEQYMDTDDTAEILMYFKKAGYSKEHPRIKKAVQWLLSMQNSDGGWGAFARNNNGNFILEFATKDFLDSADMFDESSADVTGHILEALAEYGYNIHNSKKVRKAVQYLTAAKDKVFPAWLGRWGVNYVYGTSGSLIGLLRAGVDKNADIIQSSVAWLKQRQNLYDGGFGESWAGYTHPKLGFINPLSTPSQTAWALMALLEAGEGDSPEAQRAAQYLVQNYKKAGKFEDAGTFVGTGHPKIVPMHYPSYAWGFSLMALARYKNHIQNHH